MIMLLSLNNNIDIIIIDILMAIWTQIYSLSHGKNVDSVNLLSF